MILPNVTAHIVQRGNNKQACFYQTKTYAVYLTKLKETAVKFDVQIHCFVLMTNHVHLLMTATKSNGISRLMQSLGRYYVRYFNTAYRRTGTLWEGRFKSSLINSKEHLLNVYQYIEMNPVRAHMVSHANGADKDISLITPHPLYLVLGDSKAQRVSRYNDLISKDLSETVTLQITHTSDKSLVLGNDRFVHEISQQLKRFAGHLGHGGDRRSEKFSRLMDYSD